MGGETLAVDALANAIGPAMRAPLDPARVAVAMSGGVDSAVALLRAGPRRRRGDAPALGRPERRASERVVLLAGRGDRGAARPATSSGCRTSRSTCARSSGAPSSRRSCAATRAGETPNPCVRCNGSFRFDELLALRRADRGARGSRPATTRGSSSATGGSRSRAPPTRTRIRATCSRRSTRGALGRLWFPLGGQTKEETRAAGRGGRARGRAAGPRARRRASSAATTTAPSSAPAGSPASRGRSSTRRAARVGTHDGYWRFTPGPAPRARRRRGGAALRARDRRAHEHGRRRPARVARPAPRHGARAASTAGADRVEAKLRYRSPAVAATVVADAGAASSSLLDEPAYGVAPGQTAVLYDGRRRRRLRRHRPRRLRASKIAAMLAAFASGDVADYALAVFLVVVGLGARLGAPASSATRLRPARRRSSAAPSARCCR